MIVYVQGNNKLNKGQTKLIIKYLRKVAKTCEVLESNLGICWNLNNYLIQVSSKGCGYHIVEYLSVGFPDVAMYTRDKADVYPLKNDVANGYPASNCKWEVGNRRTQLCTHIADRLQEFLDKA